MTNGSAVVTGASSGIGAEFAKELARRGHRVLAVARRRDRLETLASEAQAGRIEPLVADLSSEQGLKMLLHRIEKLDDLELLVNNAGTATAGDFVDASSDRVSAEIRLNVDAVVSLTRAALQGMVLRKRGAVLNLASVVAFQPFPHFAVYAATKAFVGAKRPPQPGCVSRGVGGSIELA